MQGLSAYPDFFSTSCHCVQELPFNSFSVPPPNVTSENFRRTERRLGSEFGHFTATVKLPIFLLPPDSSPNGVDSNRRSWSRRTRDQDTFHTHVITPSYPMSRSVVEVPDVDAIIDTLQPHPVVTSVESRQWFSLPHTTIHVQGTAGVHISPRIDWLSQVNAMLDFDRSILSVEVQGERHADAFVSAIVSPVTSIGRMPPPESVTTLSRGNELSFTAYLCSHPTSSSSTNYRAARTNTIPDRVFGLRPQVEKTIRDMERMGVIKRESSPFASPMTVVKKKDGTVRVCLDAHWVKLQMVADCDAPRPPEDLLHSFQSIRYMSTIDLPTFLLLANSTEPIKRPLHSIAVGSFSGAMDVILSPEVGEYTITYIDDLLIVSSSFEEHLGQVLQRLRNAGTTLNLEKSVFLQEKVTFLGRSKLPGNFDRPWQGRRYSAVPAPKTRKQLRAFLGLCGYYRRFCEKYSHATAPLTRLLRKDVRWCWATNEHTAFERTKKLFLLRYLAGKMDFTDGSGVAVGVECYQLLDDGEHGVLGFTSRVLMGPKLFYTVTEKELLTIMFGLQKFRTILLGHVVIRTDHYALKCLKQCRLLNHRPTRWSLMLNGFDYEVERIRGKENMRITYNVNLPIVGATLTSEKQFITALFSSSGLDELKGHFRNLPSCSLKCICIYDLFTSIRTGVWELDYVFEVFRRNIRSVFYNVSNWNLHLNLALQNPESPEPLPVQVVVLGKDTSLANELAWDTQPLIVLFLVLCFEF
ncbi:hypothetical protein GEV33_003310 [Tenebrio molitor]|uniref:RNA-directed DNA polymerase n=1 Tax=Tenebrio molitor TaxID=7067 RepID=A0A8J6HQ17_TENMO|nr:hypothetical protein GEV33_003310 [Tenebrio molitor]